MKEKIQFEIECLEFEIKEVQARLDKDVMRFKEFISNGNANRIANIPNDSLFQSIKSDVISIIRLDEKKRWLLHLIKDTD